VVALARGGARETVVPGETGALVDEQTPQAFADAIAATMARRFDRDVLREHAERFGRARFEEAMAALIAESMQAPEPAGW
jgi:glycosyltransferase involved in cell wall biosynthesis